MGPATQSLDIIKKMIKAGMNIARINFSHGTHEEHAKTIALVKQAREELKVPLGIMLDTKGPEIRIKTFKTGSAALADGATFILTTDDVEGDDSRVSISYKKLPRLIDTGTKILASDGLIELRVDKITAADIICTVVEGGILTNRKSINIPDYDLDMPYLSKADELDILFGIEHDVDYVAASFVREPADVRDIRSLLDRNGGEAIDIIAKIENRQGVDNIDKIIEASNGIMVARGDMGVEIPYEELPPIQKSIIKKCYLAGKRAITATQMLESMITSPRPTRAEISDVANAVYDGTSATMLSGETAVGRNPVETIRVMANIAVHAEDNINYKKRFKDADVKINGITDAVCYATCSAAETLDAAAILVVTQSGKSARMISRFRPDMPIIAAVTDLKAYNQMAISWGVVPVLAQMQANTDKLFAHAVELAKGTGIVKKGDTVVITAGIPVGIPGNTNIMKIEKLS